jgi:hypothetical protein
VQLRSKVLRYAHGETSECSVMVICSNHRSATRTNSAFFVPVLTETIHTWASFIDSDPLMTRATCNCGRVRREHFGKWPPGRQESCGSRSTAGKKIVFLRPKSR